MESLIIPDEILEGALQAVLAHEDRTYIDNEEFRQKIEDICRCTTKAPIRFLMACTLAKLHGPYIDIRKPYTEIGGTDAYSGRKYDETYIGVFVNRHKLPCNATTAFLTPAFRVHNAILTPDIVIEGKPKFVYVYVLEVLDGVYRGALLPENLLQEILRLLLLIKQENTVKLQNMLNELASFDALPLSSEQIVTLLHQHLECKNSSRLPVLIVAAAYLSVADRTQETIRTLLSHNAADSQTGALGDVEITLASDDAVLTCYEMKSKKVTIEDVDSAIGKAATAAKRIDNYIFITTEPIEERAWEYAKGIYDKTGVEIVILDCIGFIRHFLHFFHRHRMKFLEEYQLLVLEQPESSVGQPLKEALLALRKVAESE